MALSKIDLANQVENQLPQGLVADNVPFRNIIINGDMSIAQRGTSQASISSGGYYTCDRWRTKSDGSFGVFTQSQDTDVPTGQGFTNSLKMDCTSTHTLSANDALQIEHRIEGQNLQYLKKGTANAESLTVSFWVKSNKTGTYIAELFDSDNVRTINKSYTIDTSNTWEKKTITYAGDTTGAFNNDNNLSLYLIIWLGAGSTYTSGTLSTSWQSRVNADRAVGQVNLADSTDNNFWITGIQLEAGTSASDFEFLPYDVNLQRCYRYCQKLTYDSFFLPARTLGGDRIDFSLYINSPFRATPSLTENLTAFTLQYNNTSTGFTYSSISIVHSTFDNVGLRLTAIGTVTEPRVGIARPTGNFILDAEL